MTRYRRVIGEIDTERGKEQFMKKRSAEIRRFFTEESGIGVVEIILILVVLIGLIIIFKNQLTALVNKTFSGIIKKSGGLGKEENHPAPALLRAV